MSESTETAEVTGSSGLSVAVLTFVGYTIAGSWYAVQQFGLIALLATPLIAFGAGIASLLTAVVFLVLFFVCFILSVIPLIPLIGIGAVVSD